MSVHFCLIGHTGFVGSTLARQAKFSHAFNRSNIADLRSAAEFDLAICAAAPGSMFEANMLPEQDLAKIRELMDQLSGLRCRRFVLISSIAVLDDFAAGADEASARFQSALAYGRHRRELEVFCQNQFEDCLIVRLPALFGQGLRKNFIFDLMNPVPSMLPVARLTQLSEMLPLSLAKRLLPLYSHDAVTKMMKLDRAALDAAPDRAACNEAVTAAGFAAVNFHNGDTTYQYYDMTRLWSDIGRATEAGLSEIHLATEPLQVARIYRRLMGHDMPETNARLHREDMRTLHAGLWGQSGPYIDSAENVLDQLALFFSKEMQNA